MGKAFVKDNVFVIIGTLLVQLKAFILVPLLIKHIGVTEYGAYILLVTLLGLVFNISSLGLGFYAFRRLPSLNNFVERRELYYPQLISSFIILLIVCVFLYFSGHKLKVFIFKEEISYWVFIPIIYLLSYFTFVQGTEYFRYTLRIRRAIVAAVLYPYLHIAFIATFLIFIHKIELNGILILDAAASFLVGVVCLVAVVKELGQKFKIHTISRFKRDLSIGLPQAFNTAIDFIISSSDRFLLGYFVSITAVGYYHPGYLLGSVLMIIPKSISMVLPQTLSRLVDEDKNIEAEILFEDVLKFFIFLGVPFVVGTYMISEDFLVLFADKEISKIAWPVAPIIALSSLCFGVSYIMTNILFVRLKTRLMLKINLLVSLLNVILNLILLVYIKSVLVVAITTLICYALSSIYMNSKIKTIWRVKHEPWFYMKLLISSLIMYLINKFIVHSLNLDSAVFRVILTISSSVAVYFVTSVLLGVCSLSQIRALFRELKS